MIRLVNLTKRYGRFAAVNGLNLEVKRGEIFGFLGPNGAGKTTTIRVMMGILKATAGQVFLGGYDVEREPESAKAICGFIPDRPFIYEKMTGAELLRFAGQLRRVEAAVLERRSAELLDHFELTRWKDELVESYSHGMKQRLVVCAALIHEPAILIVDEPMVGMDPKAARTLKDLFRSLARSNTTVFVSTHSLSVAEEICHRIGIIQEGRLIACGDLAELYRQAHTANGSLEHVFLQLTQPRSPDQGADDRPS